MRGIALIIAVGLGLSLAFASLSGVEAQEATETPTPFVVRIPDRHKNVAQDTGPERDSSLRFEFKEDRDNVLALEYDNETTEIPVISPRFVDAESESEVDQKTYRSRSDRSVKLAFEVKSSPKNFGPYDILIEHWHVNEVEDRFVRTYRLANYATFVTYPISIPNALPGVNIYLMRIRYRDASGVQSSTEGARKMVVVHDEPVKNVTVKGNANSAGTTASGFWTGTGVMRLGFTLTPALGLAKAKVRISRQGQREFAGTPVLREPVWTSLHACSLVALRSDNGVSVTRPGTDERAVLVTILHTCSTTPAAEPFNDAWLYRVELVHDDYPYVLKSWVFELEAEKPKDAGGTISLKNPVE